MQSNAEFEHLKKKKLAQSPAPPQAKLRSYFAIH